MVKELLENPDLKVNEAAGKGRTALYAACAAGSLEALQVLLPDERLDVNVVEENDTRTQILASGFLQSFCQCLTPATEHLERQIQRIKYFATIDVLRDALVRSGSITTVGLLFAKCPEDVQGKILVPFRNLVTSGSDTRKSLAKVPSFISCPVSSKKVTLREAFKRQGSFCLWPTIFQMRNNKIFSRLFPLPTIIIFPFCWGKNIRH